MTVRADDSESLIPALPVGAAVKVWVTALNEGGESVNSEIVSLLVA